MSSLLTELAQMARQISAQLDTRAARLEALIREADERIDRLRSMQEAEGATHPPAPSQPSAANSEQQQRYGQIYGLADEGDSADRIAQKLEMPKGEVELILALRARG